MSADDLCSNALMTISSLSAQMLWFAGVRYALGGLCVSMMNTSVRAWRQLGLPGCLRVSEWVAENGETSKRLLSVNCDDRISDQKIHSSQTILPSEFCWKRLKRAFRVLAHQKSTPCEQRFVIVSASEKPSKRALRINSYENSWLPRSGPRRVNSDQKL